MDTDILQSRRYPRPFFHRASGMVAGLDVREVASRLALTAGAWGVGLIVTALIVISPVVIASSRSTSLHLVLSTVDACIAILAAYLVHGRWRRSRRHQDLLLAQGLILLGLAGLGLAWGSDTAEDPALSRFAIWLPLVVRALGALLIVVASIVPAQWTSAGTDRWRTLWVPVGIGAVAFAVLFAFRGMLPAVLDTTVLTVQPAILTGHPALVGTEGAAALLLLVASVAFGLHASRDEDPLFRLLGPAFAFLGFARINFLLFPSLYTQWVYSGDALRTACYGVLLFGALREVQQFWHAQSQVAVLDDRRRLARELHDGVVQELAYIRSEAADLARTQPIAVQVVNAADRGLDEARAALQALGSTSDEPLGHTLHRAAREVSARYAISLEVELDDRVDATHEQKHALMRITREAISNAARHGRCNRVILRLTAEEQGRMLVVEDDGVGFDGAIAMQANGYGLVSMRERAQALPGALSILSRRGGGTTVGVRW
jgi:signal transduction histidine kinase